jgi:LysR family nitrogen assimilation transcriptional regulator
MDMRRLRYFNTIADYGSFSAASRRLKIAQPALSRQIRLLEEEVGVELFTRSLNGVVLTEAGNRLYRHVQALMHQFGQTREIAQGELGGVAGEVAIGLPTTICAILAKPLLDAALRRYPKVRIRLVESLGSVIREMLESGSLDLAVLYNIEATNRLAVDELMVEDLCLVGVADPALEGLTTLEFRQLARFPLVLSSTAQSLRRLLETMAVSEGIELNIRLEVDSVHLTRYIAEEGLAYTVASHGVFHQEVESGRLRAIDIVNPRIRRSVAIVSAAGRQSLTSQHLHRLIREIAQGLVHTGQWRAGLIESDGIAPAPDGPGA